MSVTVVIPVYNAAPFVADTVRSALAQTHVDLTVRIAVEPGGADAPHEPDASLAALAEFSSDPRVAIAANPERLGWTGNINRMLGAVETPFFAILPHDDLWHPRFVETLLARLHAAPDAGLAYCDIRQYGERRNWRAGLPIPPDANRLAQLFGFFLEGPAGMPWRGLTRTATLALTGGFPDWDDLGIAAETEYALRLVAAAPVLHHDAVLFAKRVHPVGRLSASQERAAAALADRRAAFEGHWLKMREVVDLAVAADSLSGADARLFGALIGARQCLRALSVLQEPLAEGWVATLKETAAALDGEASTPAPRFGRHAARIAALQHVALANHFRAARDLGAERDSAAAAHRLAPDDPDAGLAHGRVLARQGRTLEAMEVLDRALRTSPNPRQIERALAGLFPAARR